ncbi:hypothetical protein PAEPH01_0469 [Pancytospora epiphaga]|nr:hypothetical protein PAEPH01_0469 [Pancytospora epiphaga]
MFLFSLLGLGQTFVIEQHTTPTLMLAQRTSVPTRAHPTGPTDPLSFEKFFKDRGFPIIIRTTRTEPRELSDRPIIFRIRRGPLEDHSSDAVSESRKLFKPRPGRKVVDENHKEQERNNNDIPKQVKRHSVLFYIFIVFLLVVVGLSGYQIGKTLESRTYVRVPSTN